MKPWGRTVLGDEDILWEYKGATSLLFHDNIDILKTELTEFVSVEFNESQAKDIVELNLLLCKNYSTNYPIVVDVNPNIADNMLGVDCDKLIIDNDETDLESKELFFLKAYHWKRKQGYWRCSFKPQK
jgi:hypothetical protein